MKKIRNLLVLISLILLISCIGESPVYDNSFGTPLEVPEWLQGRWYVDGKTSFWQISNDLILSPYSGIFYCVTDGEAEATDEVYTFVQGAKTLVFRKSGSFTYFERGREWHWPHVTKQ